MAEFESEILKRKIKTRIIAAIIFIGLFMAGQHFIRPQITGFVIAPFNVATINTPVLESTTFTIGSKLQGQALTIHSLKLSGEIVGPGDVTITLKDNENTYTIYSREHERKTKKVPLVGMVTSDIAAQQPTESEINDIRFLRKDLRITNDGTSIENLYVTNTNEENHVLLESIQLQWNDPELKAVHIDFGARNLFWQAAEEQDYASRGQEIKGASYTLRKREQVPLNIKFNKPISGTVSLSLHFRQLSSTFILGARETVTTQLIAAEDDAITPSAKAQIDSLILYQDAALLDTTHTRLRDIYFYNSDPQRTLIITSLRMNYPGQFANTQNRVLSIIADGNEHLLEPTPFGSPITIRPIRIPPKTSIRIDQIRIEEGSIVDQIMMRAELEDSNTKEFTIKPNVEGGTIYQADEETIPLPTPLPGPQPLPLNEEVENTLVEQERLSTSLAIASPGLFFTPSGNPQEASAVQQQIEEKRAKYEELRSSGHTENTIIPIRAQCLDTCIFTEPLQSEKYEIHVELTPGTSMLLDTITYY